MTFPRYSQAESPEFRDRMDRWMAVIASLFRDRLGANYVSTILMGGYGRGWGAVSVTPDGPMPVNDLDIAVVTRERLSPDDLYRLHEEATKLVNPASRYSMLDASAMDVHADVMNFIETDFASLAPTQFHLDLVHAGQVELDGVFGGGNVPVDLVQLRQGRVQRRGLARSGGTRHEDHPPGLVDGLLESGEGFLFEAELGHVELQGRLVQDSQNHLFAEQGWEHGYPELHLLAALDPELDPAVLGEPPLGDVEPGPDLQA